MKTQVHKVVFFAPRFHSNQVDLVRKLIEKKHFVSFLVLNSSSSEDHSQVSPRILSGTKLGNYLNKKFNPSSDPAKKSSYCVPSPFEIWAELNKFKPTVAILRGFLSPYILIALPWLLIHGVRIIIYTQGPQFRNAAPIKLRVFWFLAFKIFRFKWFTTVERIIGSCPAGGVSHSQMEFIPFFKEVNPLGLNRGYNKPIHFLSIGKYVTRKNLKNLILAFVDASLDSDAILTVVGEKTTKAHEDLYQDLQSLVISLKMNDRIFLKYNIPYQEIQKLYLNCSVFVLPSYSEPASVSQVEAMSAGLPIICNKDNGTAHYIIDGVTGLLVDGDVASIRSAIKVYLESPDLIHQHGQAGYKRLCTEYSTETCYQKLFKLFS